MGFHTKSFKKLINNLSFSNLLVGEGPLAKPCPIKFIAMSLQSRICKLQKEAKVLLFRGKIQNYVQKMLELEQLRSQQPSGIIFPQQAWN